VELRNEVTINLAALDNVIGELAKFSTDVTSQLDALEGHIAHLHTRWEGEAANAHANAHAEWEQGARLMAEGIDALRRASVEAHAAFTATVQANRALFS